MATEEAALVRRCLRGEPDAIRVLVDRFQTEVFSLCVRLLSHRQDAEAGIVSAKTAGMRCIAVLGTLPPERLAAADEIVPAIDLELMRRVL